MCKPALVYVGGDNTRLWNQVAGKLWGHPGGTCHTNTSLFLCAAAIFQFFQSV